MLIRCTVPTRVFITQEFDRNNVKYSFDEKSINIIKVDESPKVKIILQEAKGKNLKFLKIEEPTVDDIMTDIYKKFEKLIDLDPIFANRVYNNFDIPAHLHRKLQEKLEIEYNLAGHETNSHLEQ